MVKCFIFLVSFFSLACNSSTTRKGQKVEAIESQPIKVPLVQLAFNPAPYQEEYIETTGTFWFQFENVAVCLPSVFGERRECLWLDFDDSLFADTTMGTWLESVSGQRLTFAGYVDINRKGHLDYYVATIKVKRFSLEE